MSPVVKFGTARAWTVIALVVGGIGFVIQMIAGVTDTPTIPPGLVVILAAAGLVALLPGPSVTLAGPAAGLFNLIAMFVVGAADRLLDVSPVSAFVGAWLMFVGLILATVVGTVATVQSNRTSPQGRTDEPDRRDPDEVNRDLPARARPGMEA
jgi:hypothetical protein